MEQAFSPLAWRDLGERLVAGWDFAVGLAAAKTFTDLDKLLLPRLASAAAGGSTALPTG